MASPKDKPRGFFEYVLAIDCETTGLCFGGNTPVHNEITGEQHQTVSWGIVVADAHTLEPIEDVYVEIKWNDNSLDQLERNSTFGKKAQSIHGLTITHLEEHGVSEEEAVAKIANLIIKYWGPENNVCLLGHNVSTFDLHFFRDLMSRVGVPIKLGNRHLDSWSVGYGVMETFNSDDLFTFTGMPGRDTHNALDDAKMALNAVRVIRQTWNKLLEGG